MHAAEVLIEASERLGRPILKEVWRWDLMNVADAIADVGFLSGLLMGGGVVAVIVFIAYVNFARGVRW